MRQRTLILGSGEVALQLVQRLNRHAELGLEPVGYIDDDVHEPGRLGIPRLGTLDSLPDLITFGRVDRVMIAFTRAKHEDLLHAIRVCRDAGVTVDIVPRLFEFLEGARTEQIGGMPLMSIRQPTFSRLSRDLQARRWTSSAPRSGWRSSRRCCSRSRSRSGWTPAAPSSSPSSAPGAAGASSSSTSSAR